ncbi:hypothetical protein JOC70_001123 [Clostridium pascui]|uniref:DUF4652 domain-containing protein n=1 Tax=Clostridium pascui TaxID=46609 RepID=UPI00195DA8E1|nr:DUF4652 domain-containing protein [Clostridium pascui]MBM7869653.1 hypothetical protein [Clostridium pascui]
MNCSIFLKRLDDYIEDNLSMDMKIAMEKHLDECSSCKAYYEEEVNIEKAFKGVIQNKDIVFGSCRSSIMDSIDKSMYEKKLSKRMILYFKRYKFIYSTCAALLIGFISLAPYISNKLNESAGEKLAQNKTAKNIMLRNDEPENFMMKSVEEKIQVKQAPDATLTKPTVFLEEKYVFKKNSLESNTIPSMIWKESPDKKVSAAIEGQNIEGTEEGIHPIILRENATKKIYKLSFKDESIQYAPKKLQWWDDKNLLVIIGYGFGTITKGGDLFIVNIDTGNTYSVYKTQDDKKEVTDVEKVSNNDGSIDFKLKLNVYEDENYLKSHLEEKLIENFQVVYDK